jgi:hypothetical protein
LVHRYVLDQIDDTIFSTDCFEVYCLYLKLFDYDRYCNVMYRQKPCIPVVKGPPANHETWVRCLKKERSAYERGFIPKRVSDEKMGSKVVWVENQGKAKMMLSKIKVV